MPRGLRRSLLPTALCLLAWTACAEGDADRGLLLATTTSVHDSGLLGEILPEFERRSGLRVRVVAVGTGAALRMGERGDADVLLTHAPEGERELVASGAALARTPFMQNHFVIAGPAGDPAGVRGAASVEEAMRRAATAAYISRGDDSGTHRRERELLRAAGLREQGGWDGFASTGTGMGLTLQVAAERGAYVLSDIGTFLAFRERTGLEALSRPGPRLRNVYSLVRLSPERFGGRIDSRGALQLERFLLAPETRRRIAAFGRERFGQALFEPLPEPSAT
ncbi:MAG: substrate-binding domain-containing protein [Proteobacteria bacterium]|nr:substrate-binding domain-containing protein [Pseudomonadota bacterium]